VAGHELEGAAKPESPAATAAQVDVWQRTSMAAERTWLAWWRTALTATAGVAFTVVLVGAQI
jgi:uncharacterized membrane protein YidH (DUF202 family)